MNMRSISLLVAFLIATTASFAQVETRSYYADEGLIPRPHSVDFISLKLKASFEPENNLIKGKVEESFKVLQQGVDTLFLDAINMTFNTVQLDGSDVDFSNTGKGIVLRFKNTLEWDSEHIITIVYEATPAKGLYFVGWNDTTNRSRKQIWTQGQGINNRHWIPLFDEKNDKLISEMIVDFDEAYQVLSNGEKLKEKKIGNGKKQWHYKISHPHAPYLIMLGIGDYAIKTEKSASGVPMNYYFYPDQPEQVEPTYRFSKAMFDFFEKEIGVPYPWKTYSQIPVQDFMYGAMENTTATIFGDFYLVDERTYLDKNYVRVNAHELAHQWFGDMVTARSSAHHWLQESFATHYDMMYQKEAFGADHYNWVRRNYNNQALDASKNDLKPIAHSAAGTVRHYPKGAFTLQMLKYVVGREQFNAAIKHYLEKHAYGNVDSKNLLVAFHERLGLSLNWFWEEWIYKGGEPSYNVELKESATDVQFYVTQTQEQNDLVGLFKMPIVFELHYEDGTSESKKVWIENQSHLVTFNDLGGKKLSYALFDPNNQVMKSVEFNKSTNMLLAQAEKAEHMLDRYDAIAALITREFSDKESFLMKRFEAESFHGIKAAILQYILPLLNENSEKLAQIAINDPKAEVRLAALESTLRVPAELESDYRSLLNDSSYQVIEKALGILSFYLPQNVETYLELTKDELGNRSHNVRVEWLKVAYVNSNEKKYLNELVDYTSNSFEFITRINAAKALKELNVFNELALAHLLDASFSFNSRLRGPAGNVIDHFYEQAAYKTMILNYVVDQNWGDNFNKVSKYLVY